jgi:VanZ family protein
MRLLVRRVPLLLVVVLLLVSGLLVQPAEGIPHQDKLHHVIGFFCLALALRMAFPRLGAIDALVLSVAAACSVEMGQALLPERTSSVADVAAGVAGALLGWSIGWCVQRLKQARARREIEDDTTAAAGNGE